MKKIGVLSWPALSTNGGNPYNYILFSKIEQSGHKVNDFVFSLKYVIRFLLPLEYKVFHIHWPTHVLVAETYSKARLKLYMFFSFVHVLKAWGVKIVWTVHNLEAHESKFPSLQKKLDSFMYKHVDGFISLNASGLPLIKNKTEKETSQLFAHTFHPHYRNYYENKVDRKEARAALGILEDKFVFLFLGQIRAYKNVIGLIKAYRDLKRENALLLIAGSVHKDVETELREQLSITDGVTFVNSFIKDEELQLYFNCADVVVTPYNKVFNSGSVFLNLSFSKPTIAPDVLAMTELQQVLGSKWIKTYHGVLSAEVLEKSMVDILAEANSNSTQDLDLSRLEPERIAQETVAFYQSLFKNKL
jgi:glycosyltransferase involved in cell wall biosynthesis